MTAPSFMQKALQQYLLEHAPFYREQERVWLARMQSATSFDQQALMAIFAPFQQAVLASAFDGQQAYALVEQHNAAPYTLRLVLSDASLSQQITMIQVSQAVIDAYKHTIGSLPVNVQWLVSGGIESEHNTSAPFSSLLPAQSCVWDGSGWTDLEVYGTPCLALGCKGRLGIELKVADARVAQNVGNHPVQVSSSFGTIAPNVAWRLLWAITSLKSVHEEILIDGFYDTLMPADDDEIALLHTLPDIRPYMVQRLGIENVLMGLSGLQLHYTHLLTPTCTVTHVSSGEQGKNVMPDQGVAQVDFQLLPGQEPDDIFAKLRRHLDAQGFHDVEVRTLYVRPTVKTPLQHPFVQQVQKATQVAYGRQPTLLPLVGSARPYTSFQDGTTPTVLISSDYAQHTGYQQEQRFLALSTQIALLIEYIQV